MRRWAEEGRWDYEKYGKLAYFTTNFSIWSYENIQKPFISNNLSEFFMFTIKIHKIFGKVVPSLTWPQPLALICFGKSFVFQVGTVSYVGKLVIEMNILDPLYTRIGKFV